MPGTPRAAAGGLVIVAHNGARIFGGAERALLRLLHGLQQRGHDVTLCCNHELVVRAAERAGVRAVRMPLRGDLVLSDALRFARFLRRQRPDVVLFGTFKKIWLGGLAAALAGVPLRVARIGLASDTPRRLKYRIALARWIDVIVLNAESMRPAFVRGMPAGSTARVVVIHNGVARPAVTTPARDVRAAHGIPADAVVVGTVARLARQKRLERLIEAVALLPPHVHALLVGVGPERALLERTIARHALGGRVHLPGHSEDVGSFLAALDVFVICSDQEGMANAMLEAMTMGVPVVSTPVSGAAEALEPLPSGVRPGLIADGFSPAALAAELRPLIADTQLRASMAAAAARASERFSVEHMIDSWDALLQQEVQ
jgi:glycosyltransferase involved in cell wall biosynthesis